jgi:serine/threonine protein kinase
VGYVVELGRTQLGAYRILQQIGAGGMGAVYLAEHVALGRRAAIKVLHPELSGRAEIVTRFFNEARAATAINDPGIVQIFDFGHHSDGSAYIVMELLDGESLERRLERMGVVAIRDALRVMRQVASSLGAAHARGIVHRDLKPDNIFVVRDLEVPGGERAKVLDFGIAKLIDDQGTSRTHTSAVMGTPMYMSPEQCRGAGQVDQRSDVYSLGCVLFALVVGRPPFDAAGVGDIIAMHLREPAPAPSQLRAGIPPEVDQLVLRCLAKDPALRFQTAGELAIAIGTLLGSSPQLHASVHGLDDGRVSLSPTTLSSASGAGSIAPVAPSARTWSAIAAILVCLGVIAGGIAIIATREHGHAAPVSPSEPMHTAAPPPPVAKPDPNAEITDRMTAALTSFSAWSRDHAGAPCPDAAALGDVRDPWGAPIQITCVDQPANQIVGAISAGPDGVVGTHDDIASWQLGREVTALVEGRRWVAAAPVAKPEALKPPVKKTVAATKPTPKPTTAIELDENGMPIAR